MFIGIDVSTTATKALVIDSNNVVLSRGYHAFKPLVSNVPAGRAEQEPSEWIHGVKTAVKQALSAVDASLVKAVSVSGQQHGFVPLNSDHEVIRPAKLWCDVESSAEAAELSTTFGYELVPGFTASKILWLKRNELHNFQQLRHVLLPHDYVNYYLTGRTCMEASDSSGTGLFDIHDRSWSRPRMDAIDSCLHEFMPDLVHCDKAIGRLTTTAASDLGLHSDVIVAPGAGDNAASAMGSGAVQAGIWVLSLGTSGTLFGASPAAVWDPSGTVAPFCDATGQWLPLVCTQNCSQPATEVSKAFQMDHDALTKLALMEQPGCCGVNFLPYLTGERTPNLPQSTGAIIGLRPGCLRPGLLYRAALEGAAMSLFAGMKVLRSFGAEATELRLVGGGSRNPLWRQIIADVFQVPVRIPVEADSAALGAALQAAAVYDGTPVRDYIAACRPPMESEVVQPRVEMAEVYRQAFDRHQAGTRDLFARPTAR